MNTTRQTLSISVRLAVACAVILIAVIFMTSVTRPGARDLTLKTINDTSKRVGQYFMAHGRLPDGLSQVTASANVIADSWHRDVQFRVLSADRYELRSFGPDGIPSGDDIARSFRNDDLTTASSNHVK